MSENQTDKPEEKKVTPVVAIEATPKPAAAVVTDTTPKVVRAVVTEALPSTLFRVEINGQEILAYLSGKMRLHRIRILVGDSVEVLLDPYGGKGRITRRL